MVIHPRDVFSVSSQKTTYSECMNCMYMHDCMYIILRIVNVRMHLFVLACIVYSECVYAYLYEYLYDVWCMYSFTCIFRKFSSYK